MPLVNDSNESNESNESLEDVLEDGNVSQGNVLPEPATWSKWP